MKTANKKLEQELEDSKSETAAEKKRVEKEKGAVEAAAEKIKGLEETIDELKNSNEAAERVQLEVNKVKAEKDNEVALLSEKVGNAEKQLAEQKRFYEGKMKEL